MSAVLYLGPERAQYWARDGKRWLASDGDPAPDAALTVVCDLPEESIADVDMPPLRGRDRADYLARQQLTRFPDTRYRAIVPLRASKRLARGKLLLLGVAAQGRLDGALTPLVEAGKKITGVWPVSGLLTALAQSPRLPETLFVVFPSPAGLRIVFLKNRVPLLSRLASAADTPEAQIEELSRTRRYLENSRAIERGDVRYPLLHLGSGEALREPLARLRLDPLALPAALATGATSGAPDSSLPLLFELATKAPPGQTAPLPVRRHFLADRIRKSALAGAAGILALSLWAASDNLSAIAGTLARAERAQRLMGDVAAENTRLEEAIAAHGVSPDTVRQAVDLEKRELTAIPDLRSRLAALSRVIGESEGTRLTRLSWALKSEDKACAGETGGIAGGVADVPAGTGQVVEIDFAARLPEGLGPRAQAQVRQRLSDRLQGMPDASLKRDPSRALKEGALSGGTERSGTATDGLRWCLTLRIAQTPGSQGG